MPAAQVAQAVQHVGHSHGNRGLAGTWAAGEIHVQVRPGSGRPEPGASSVDEQERGNLADPPLDRGETDQVLVQGLEDFIDTGLGAVLTEVDPGVRRKRLFSVVVVGFFGCRRPGRITAGSRHAETDARSGYLATG